MNREDDFELRLAELLEAGPFEAPDHVVSTAIEHARTHPQRRLLRFASWRSAMDSMHLAPVTPRHSNNLGRAFAVGLAAIVVVAAIALGATLLGRGGTTPAPGGIPAPVATPVSTPTATPTPTPVAVTGTGYCGGQGGTETQVGDVEQIRGLVLGCSTTASDPRVSGWTAVHVNIDIHPDQRAELWGTTTITGPDGTWTGPWVGFIEKGYTTHRMASVLRGTGAYAGLQYRYTQTSEDGANTVSSGVIEPIPVFEASESVTGRLAVTGTESCSDVALGSTSTSTVVGGATQVRNASVHCIEYSSDPRVASISSTRTYNHDDRGSAGVTTWGTSEVDNAGGTWTGVWSGTADANGNGTITWISIGSGGYSSLLYRATVSVSSESGVLTVTGAIEPIE